MEHDLKEINVPSNPEIEKLQQQVIAIVVVSRSKQTNPLNYAKASFPPSTMSLPPVHNIWSILSSFCACYRVSVLCLHSYFFFCLYLLTSHFAFTSESPHTFHSIEADSTRTPFDPARSKWNWVSIFLYFYSFCFTSSILHHLIYQNVQLDLMWDDLKRKSYPTAGWIGTGDRFLEIKIY